MKRIRNVLSKVRKPLFEDFYKIKIPFALKVSEVPEAAKKSWGWIAFNVGVFFTYIFFSLNDIADFNEVISAGGDDGGFMWGWERAFIVIFLMTPTNMVWLLVVLWKRSRPTLFLWLLTIMIWVSWILLERHIMNWDLPTRT